MSPPTPPTWYDPYTGWIGGGPLPFLTPPMELPPEPFPTEPPTVEPIGLGPLPTEPPTSGLLVGGPPYLVMTGAIVGQCAIVSEYQLPPLGGQIAGQTTLAGPFNTIEAAQAWIDTSGFCVQAQPTLPAPQPAPSTECKPDLKVEICNWPDSLKGSPPKPIPPKPPKPETLPSTVPSQPTAHPGQPQPINAGQASSCDQIDQFANQYAGQSAGEILTTAGVTDSSGQFIWVGQLRDTVEDIPLVGEILAAIVSMGGALLVAPITAWITIQGQVSSLVCSNAGAIAQIANMRGPLTWMRRLLGIETRQIETVLHNWENYICPVNVPSVIDADIARRTGDINKDEWRCWVRLNGLDETVYERVYNSHRLQLTPEQLIFLWRRKNIKDDEIGPLLAKAGMISTDDQMRLDQITQFVPPVSDLLHFIVRGIGDPEIVQRFKLLEEFDQLYQGKLVEWGESNGIAKETMEYYHAGHWVVPAPGQLYTMMQRLRPDNVPPGIDADDWVTTHDDLDRALRENAYAPFWRPRLEAISYTPLGIRQIRKAYVEGGMQQDQVIDALKTLGYSGFTAVEYFGTLEIERRDFLRRHYITKLYMDAAINRQDADTRLQQEGYLEGETKDALDFAGQEFQDKSRQKCIEGFHKRYECGELDQGQLQEQLSQVGLDNDQIVTLATRWDCERKSCGKQVAAGQLCSWAESGLITPQEYKRRLTNVGYSDVDASNIVAECNIKLETKQLAQRERAARQLASQLAKVANRKASADRQAVAAAKRAARELRQLQRQAASDQARAERAAKSATDRTNRIRAAMVRAASSQAGKIRVKEAMLAKAAEQWAVVASLDLPAAAAQVTQALEAVAQLDGLPSDTQIRAVLLAVLGAKKAGTVDLTQAAVDLAHAMQGYASVASAAVCEQTNEGCGATQSNGGNAGQVSTIESHVHPVEPLPGSIGDRISGR